MYKIAVSQCPNDLFTTFFLPKDLFDITYAPNEQLNKLVFQDEYDLVKMSVPLISKVNGRTPLSIGASFTLKAGPIFFKTPSSSVVYLPSPDSTAATLFRMYLSTADCCVGEIRYRNTEEIERLVADGQRSGVVIHHGASSPMRNMSHAVDLGEYYCDLFKAPLPLAVLMCKTKSNLKEIERQIRLSIRESLRNEREVFQAISDGYLNKDIRGGKKRSFSDVEDFVNTYVTSLSYELGLLGYRSIALFRRVQFLLRNLR